MLDFIYSQLQCIGVKPKLGMAFRVRTQKKFEAAIKKEAPDLFEAQPDLLFQLVTLMNPQRLTDAGVRV